MTREAPESVQVVGLGQVCVDYVGRIPDYPAEDSKMELEGLYTSCGGPAATALVTLARSGVGTAFLGSISDDPFGIQIVESLKKEGVDISSLTITPGFASQFAFIAVTEGNGNRTIFWRRSTAPELRPEDVSLARFSRARILHLDGLMVAAGRAAALQAKRRGMTVVMDAGTLREDTLDLVKEVDIVVASEGFGRSLVGPGGTYEEVLERLRALGCRQAVVTLGVNGSIGLGHDGSIRQLAFPVPSRDTTGAGDVYHGAYIFGLLQGWGMTRCMAFASAAAALKCRNGGGWQGIPREPEIEDLLEKTGA